MKLLCVLLITLPYLYFAFQAIRRLVIPKKTNLTAKQYSEEVAFQAAVETVCGAACFLGFILLFLFI